MRFGAATRAHRAGAAAAGLVLAAGSLSVAAALPASAVPAAAAPVLRRPVRSRRPGCSGVEAAAGPRQPRPGAGCPRAALGRVERDPHAAPVEARFCRVNRRTDRPRSGRGHACRRRLGDAVGGQSRPRARRPGASAAATRSGGRSGAVPGDGGSTCGASPEAHRCEAGRARGGRPAGGTLQHGRRRRRRSSRGVGCSRPGLGLRRRSGRVSMPADGGRAQGGRGSAATPAFGRRRRARRPARRPAPRRGHAAGRLGQRPGWRGSTRLRGDRGGAGLPGRNRADVGVHGPGAFRPTRRRRADVAGASWESKRPPA